MITTTNTSLPLTPAVEDRYLSRKSISRYARKATQIEQKVFELLEKSLHDDPAEARSVVDLPKSARTRQGENLRGG